MSVLWCVLRFNVFTVLHDVLRICVCMCVVFFVVFRCLPVLFAWERTFMLILLCSHCFTAFCGVFLEVEDVLHLCVCACACVTVFYGVLWCCTLLIRVLFLQGKEFTVRFMVFSMCYCVVVVLYGV